MFGRFSSPIRFLEFFVIFLLALGAYVYFVAGKIPTHRYGGVHKFVADGRRGRFFLCLLGKVVRQGELIISSLPSCLLVCVNSR